MRETFSLPCIIFHYNFFTHFYGFMLTIKFVPYVCWRDSVCVVMLEEQLNHSSHLPLAFIFPFEQSVICRKISYSSDELQRASEQQSNQLLYLFITLTASVFFIIVLACVPIEFLYSFCLYLLVTVCRYSHVCTYMRSVRRFNYEKRPAELGIH